jgi:hypothetical protein
VLKVAGLGDGQQAKGGQFAIGAAVTETDLAPLHAGAEGTFNAVIGGLYAVVFQESKEPVVMLEQSRGEIADLARKSVFEEGSIGAVVGGDQSGRRGICATVGYDDLVLVGRLFRL